MSIKNKFFPPITTTIVIGLASVISFSAVGCGQIHRSSQVKTRTVAQVNNSRTIPNPAAKKEDEEVQRLHNEAIRLLNAKQFPQALTVLETALTLSRKVSDRTAEGDTLNIIGKLYQQQGKYTEALTYFQQALAVHKANNNLGALGKTFSNVGFVFEQLNKPALAALFYKECVNNREQVRFKKGTPLERHEPYIITALETYQALGKLLTQQQRIPEAQRIIDLTKAQEIDQFFQGMRGNQNTAKGIELMPQEQKIFQNINVNLDQAITLGKELEELRKIPPEKRTEAQKQRLKELVKTQQKIQAEFINFINSPAVAQQVEELTRNEQRQNIDLASLNDIRATLARLPQKPALIYPLILKDSVEMILVTPESPPIHRSVPVKREEINRTIAAFREALQDPTRDAKIPGKQLYNWLIKPLENDLKQAKTQTLIYAPDSQLRYVPLTALNDGNQWLVQRFNINYITAASLTDFNAKPKEKLRILAAAFTKGRFSFQVANRQFAFSGLPFAGEEVENLVKAIPGTTKLLDNEFTPNSTVPQMDDHTIVHLATHAAFMVGKPEDSFILFGNGDRVTLKDISTWSLPRVDLVVLSACETGLGGKLGNGEEILGFGYQIQKTGAKGAIASLWAVDDGGTEALMSAFYSALSSGKLTKAESLRQAQMALITGNFTALGSQRGNEIQQNINRNIPKKVVSRLNHPYYWAPFILIGNGF